MSIFDSRYGSITAEDAGVLEASMTALLPRDRLKILEVGIYQGGTATGMLTFLSNHGCGIEYWGVDAGYMTPPREPFGGARIIVGLSEEVFEQIPDDFDLVFIDGCHCRNHVVLDTCNYSSKVKVGGFLLFHDVHPDYQGTDKQCHGPNTRAFQISVVDGLKLISFPWPGWELFKEDWSKQFVLGGIRSYRRVT